MASQSAGRIPTTAPRPGDLFAEKYRIERMLGVGGMGYVMAATHIHLQERVAIKMLLPELVDEEETVRRFLREGRAAVRIQSPHVARVKDVGELPNRTPYLVMEYLDGSDLDAVLDERGRIPFPLAIEWVLQACEAVAEAHAMQTVHRDLKPSNLFLAKMPNGVHAIKVLDFGISKMISSDPAAVAMTSTMAVMGSPTYMSPEQLKASRSVDHRADIWSLGVILHELISGAAPFDAQTLAELSVQILSEEPPWLADAVPEVPAELAGIVATCLRKKADARFVDLADLANALAPFGGESAWTSAKRITATLGMPTTRATVTLTPPARARASSALEATHHAAPAPTTAALSLTPRSTHTPTQSTSAAKVFIAFAVALATLGLLAGGLGLYRRGAATNASAHPDLAAPTAEALAPPAATHAPPNPTASTATRTPSEGLDPGETSAAPMPAVPTSAPASAPHKRPPSPSTSTPVSPRSSASAPASSPPPKPTSPSSIATSSKD